MMAPDDPRHGTRAGYIASCRCPACRVANRRENKAREIRRMHDGPLIVDATDALRHITWCRTWGMTFEAIGPSAGRIHAGLPRVHRTTSDRILAARPQPGVNCWPAHGAVRRLQALMALGHEAKTLAAHLQLSQSYLSMLFHGTRGWTGRISPDLWHRVAALYDELSMQRGPATATANRARAHRWPPPLCWDEDTIDDPKAQPRGIPGRRVNEDRTRHHDQVDEAVVVRVLAGEQLPTTRAEREEIVARHVAAGGSQRDLCERLGWRDGRYTRRAVAA